MTTSFEIPLALADDWDLDNEEEVPVASQDGVFLFALKLKLLLTAKSVLHKKYNSIVVVNILLLKLLSLL